MSDRFFRASMRDRESGEPEKLRYDPDSAQKRIPYALGASSPFEVVVIDGVRRWALKPKAYSDDVFQWIVKAMLSSRNIDDEERHALMILAMSVVAMVDNASYRRHQYSDSPSERLLEVNYPSEDEMALAANTAINSINEVRYWQGTVVSENPLPKGDGRDGGKGNNIGMILAPACTGKSWMVGKYPKSFVDGDRLVEWPTEGWDTLSKADQQLLGEQHLRKMMICQDDETHGGTICFSPNPDSMDAVDNWSYKIVAIIPSEAIMKRNIELRKTDGSNHRPRPQSEFLRWRTKFVGWAKSHPEWTILQPEGDVEEAFWTARELILASGNMKLSQSEKRLRPRDKDGFKVNGKEVEVLNYTEHDIVLYDKAGKTILRTFKASGKVCRATIESYPAKNVIATDSNGDDIIVSRVNYAGATLPAEREGVVYLVSSTAARSMYRYDTYGANTSPGFDVRNAAGQVIGCRGLIQF